MPTKPAWIKLSPVSQPGPSRGSSTATPGTDGSVPVAQESVTTETSLAESVTMTSFYQATAASQTATQMLRPGAAAALSVEAPFRGSVLGLGLTASANKTAGTFTATVYVAGSATEATLTWSNSTATTTNTFLKGDYSFSAGDAIDVRVTTDAGFLPDPSTVEVILYLAFNKEASGA